MRTLLAAVALTALLLGPSHAQMTPEGGKDPLQLQYEQEENARKAIDKDYDEAMKRTRTHAAPQKRDPWGNVRSINSDSTKR
jgi:hypothetical protein